MTPAANSPTDTMAGNTRTWLRVAQTGHFSLLIWVAAWHSLISPPAQFSPWVLALVWSVPLLFPLKGILKAKPYTFAWSNFILLLYFLHSLTLLYVDEGERSLAAIELVLTCLTFAGNLMYSRLRGKELGLRLKKLSEEAKEEALRHSR